MIDRIATALIAGAVLAAAGTVWVWRYQAGLKDGHKDRDIAVAAVQSAWDQDRLNRSAMTLELVSAAVAERNAQQERADAATRQYLDLRERHERAVADAARDVDRLRSAIETYATGPDRSADPVADLAACSERAGALGRLLGQALRAGAECAADGESDRAAARALWDAWPVQVTP